MSDQDSTGGSFTVNTDLDTNSDRPTGNSAVEFSDVRCNMVTGSDVETGLYKLRWYILIVYGVSTALQNTVWASWGPIAQSAKAVYNWKNSTVAVMINCGNVGVLICLVGAGFLCNKKGLRVSMLACTFLLSLGAGLRVVTMEPVIATVLIGAGQFLNGVAGSITAVIPTVISETWFPSNERTTATAIGVISNTVGGVAAFLLGPNIVPQPIRNNSWNDSISNRSHYVENISIIRDKIWLFNMIEFIWGVVLLLLTLVYYPARPAKPPSRSAAASRLQFRKGLKDVIAKPNVWQIALVCAIPWAVTSNWMGMLDVNLDEIGITQIEAGRFGFYCTLFGSIGGSVIGIIADKVQRRQKSILLVVYMFSFLSVAWFVCMRLGFIPRSHAMFAVAIAMFGVFSNGGAPLCYEMACETGYPVSESIIGLFLGLLINLAAVVFLLIQTIPCVGVTWMNWALLGVYLISIPALGTYKENYFRLEIDKSTNTDCAQTTEPNSINANHA